MNLTELRKIAAARTPGEWYRHAHGKSGDSWALIRDFGDAYMRGSTKECWYLTCTEKMPHTFTSIVGNGPNSAQNSEFIATMANHIDALLAVVGAAQWIGHDHPFDKNCESCRNNLEKLREALAKLEAIK